MARRKNVKRIDPRYFLHETVNRNDDGSAMEEGCPSEEGAEAIDISAPGMEVHVDDISQLSPEEAFAAGMAAARDAIDQVMGAPDGPPPDGGPGGEPAMHETTLHGHEELNPALIALMPKILANPGENFQKKYARHANIATNRDPREDEWGLWWVKEVLRGGIPIPEEK